jgi:GT2 family glycosyltransferase
VKKMCSSDDITGSFETMQNMPLVSVIILNWNGVKFIQKCLDSVLASDYSNLEVIVSDNGSVDGSQELIKRDYPQVILIENKRNLGFCEGNNIAIQRSRGDIVILLNNDTEVDKNWIKEIVRIAKNPEVGIIGCVLYFAHTKFIETAGFCIHPSGRNLLIYTRFQEVDYVSGGALAVKRSVLERIGLLDPFFFAYCEDMDLCYRAKKGGYKVVMAYTAIVHHYGSQSWRRLPIKQMYLSERNRLYFIFKHFQGLRILKTLTYYEFLYFLMDVKKVITTKTVPQRRNIIYDGPHFFTGELLKTVLQKLALHLIAFILLLIWPAYWSAIRVRYQPKQRV